jgi:uncharacterized membrane protein
MFRKIFNAQYLTPIVILGAITVRLYGLTLPAQPYDIGTYQAWGTHFLSVGPVSFFDTIWSDYLPLPIMSFAVPAYLSKVFALDFTLIFKATHTILELVLIYAVIKTTNLKNKLITALLIISPALIGNTTYWGQVDAIPSLLSLLSLSLLTNKVIKPSSGTILASLCYGLAVAYKPIMLLIVLFFLTISGSKKKKT